MTKLSAALILCLSILWCSSALASPCQGNWWQPTFVHDLERPDGPWYVHANGAFTKLRGNTPYEWTRHACELIGREGVRNRQGFTNCQNYTQIQCGCTRSIGSSGVCLAFLRNRR